MTQNYIPIRMCAVCKTRFNQANLRRYRIIDSSLFHGKGNGRSFYICEDCLIKDEKILKKSLGRVAGNFIATLQNEQNLKEILLNGEYSDFRDSE
ncbi:DUF448 domain-containing protein [Campylobacter sp. RM16188]|uniref:DUF448 domain-containing protein n=1 Tax=Campylobacter sp. RM16188 TaxID=1705725 RepID=UPI00155397C3|nr:DUF448 domain-containing protein [Campylobacter sp. RM16188]